MTKDDLISRQAAIDALWKALYEYEDKTEKQFQESEDLDVGDWILHRIFVQNMSDIDRQTILNLPSAQQWISTSERLPENDNDVLVTDGTDCAVAYWRTDAQAWDDYLHGWCDLYGLEVVAWMPLPEPWKGGPDGTAEKTETTV